jgi:hypothetical protein
MKTKPLCLALIISSSALIPLQLKSQGFIVPNGVVDGGYQPGLGYEINVVHDPNNYYYTGFFLNPKSINTFQFSSIVDVGVRVFQVSANDPISLQPILSQAYPELSYPNTYVFADGVPFYLGLYTGNVQQAPQDGIYNDPLFGWAELENVGGTIEFLNGTIEYQGGGIYAGTQTIIPVPEPNAVALTFLGALLPSFHRWRQLRKSIS